MMQTPMGVVGKKQKPSQSDPAKTASVFDARKELLWATAGGGSSRQPRLKEVARSISADPKYAEFEIEPGDPLPAHSASLSAVAQR